MRSLKWILILAAVLGLSSCATEGKRQMTALERAQYAWTAAIRWGDIPGAWKQLDPDYRTQHAHDDEHGTGRKTGCYPACRRRVPVGIDQREFIEKGNTDQRYKADNPALYLSV